MYGYVSVRTGGFELEMQNNNIQQFAASLSLLITKWGRICYLFRNRSASSCVEHFTLSSAFPSGLGRRWKASLCYRWASIS